MSSKESWEKFWDHDRTLDELYKEVEEDPLRIKSILNFIPMGKVLEAGCGIGRYVFYLSRLGYDIYGVDFLENVIERNRQLANSTKVIESSRFQVMDITRLEYPDNNFDGYLSMGVIEHFKDPIIPLKEAYRVLKKGGIIFVTVPNRHSPWHLIRSIISKLRIFDLVWQKEYSVSQLIEFVSSAGFDILKGFNCNVRESFQLSFGLRVKKIGAIINPFQYLRRILLRLADFIEQNFPIFGYHSVVVACK
jgi:SAM-dependent methyltransferase